MFKQYGEDTQKGKIIRIFILKDNVWLEDFELEQFRDIFVGNSAGSRLSELKKDGICKVEYFENPKGLHKHMGKRAKYKLTDDAYSYYRGLLVNEILKPKFSLFGLFN